MFARLVAVECVRTDGAAAVCPVRWLDSFAMRNFTNDAIFDDTLPMSDGRMEIGRRVPVELLRERMEDWFRRKGYIAPGEHIAVRELTHLS